MKRRRLLTCAHQKGNEDEDKQSAPRAEELTMASGQLLQRPSQRPSVRRPRSAAARGFAEGQGGAQQGTAPSTDNTRARRAAPHAVQGLRHCDCGRGAIAGNSPRCCSHVGFRLQGAR